MFDHKHKHGSSTVKRVVFTQHGNNQSLGEKKWFHALLHIFTERENTKAANNKDYEKHHHLEGKRRLTCEPNQ